MLDYALRQTKIFIIAKKLLNTLITELKKKIFNSSPKTYFCFIHTVSAVLDF
jgi:predicted cation transporter